MGKILNILLTLGNLSSGNLSENQDQDSDFAGDA